MRFRVVWHRGHIMQQATGLGCMAAVSLTPDAATDVISRFGERLSIMINGPRSVVLSGDAAALEQTLSELDRQGVRHKMPPVNYAFHSAQMPFRQRWPTRCAQRRSGRQP